MSEPQTGAATRDATGEASPAAAESTAPAAGTEAAESTAPAAGTEAAENAAAEAGAPAPESAAPGTPSPASRGRKGLLLGVGGGFALIVVLALAAFVWPGFLAGPGKPDETAAAAVASLGSKNSGELEKVSCHGPDGKSLGQLSPEALQIIQGAKAAGPTTLVLDTQAQLPVELTLSAQGQTQNVPANLVFAVDDGKWCMAGLSMRQ